MKKPPDNYKCLKIPIKNILKNQDNTKILSTLENAVLRTNKIVIKTYLLLRLWILEKYHSNIEIPEISEDTIKFAMKACSNKQEDSRIKGFNKILLDEFINLANIFPDKEDSVNLSGTLQAYQTTMLTSIENNISLHFIDYINRFINSYFYNLYFNEINSDKVFKKQLGKELCVLKKDIINETTLSLPKYHEFLNIYRTKIIPKNPENCISHYASLKKYPQLYLKSMIFMNIELEKISGKMFQFLPIQSNIGINSIQIDTKQLIDLFIETEHNLYLNDIEKYKNFLWDKFFDIKSSKNFKDYVFSHAIVTDGYTVSVRYIHKDHYIKDQLKKLRMKSEKNRRSKLTDEQKVLDDIEKFNKKQKQKEVEISNIKKIKENKEKVVKKQKEFQYIDDYLNNSENSEKIINLDNCIFGDPGKNNLFTFVDNNNKFLFYTNSQRLQDTKRVVYGKKLQKYKDNINISTIENILVVYNSKTCSLEKFKEYINKKLEINEILRPLYKQNKLDLKIKKYRWYSHINTKRANDKMLNLIEKTYGSKKTIIMGDWSVGKQMANFISTPNLTLKRQLTRRFKVLDIDEFRTSCLHYKTEQYVENLHLPDKTNKIRKIHQVLTCQMENNRNGCITRDKNGCLNIKKLATTYITTGEIPYRYRRNVEIE